MDGDSSHSSFSFSVVVTWISTESPKKPHWRKAFSLWTVFLEIHSKDAPNTAYQECSWQSSKVRAVDGTLESPRKVWNM